MDIVMNPARASGLFVEMVNGWADRWLVVRWQSKTFLTSPVW